MPLKRFSTSLPKIGHLDMGLLTAEVNQGPEDSGRAFYFPLDHWRKNSRARVWCRKKTLTRNNDKEYGLGVVG